MLNALKCLKTGNVEDVNNSMLYPLLRWGSGNRNTLHLVQKVNGLFFWVPQELSKLMLSDVAGRFPPFMRYPKPAKFSDKKYDVLAEVLKRKYGWSKRELLEQRAIIISLLGDSEYLRRLANESGMEDKELRKLGLKTTRVAKAKKRESRDLFNF